MSPPGSTLASGSSVVLSGIHPGCVLPTWEDVLLGPDSRKLSFVPNLKPGQLSENEASSFASFMHVKSLPLTRVHTFAGEKLVLYSFTKPARSNS